jgi:mono/diheme cytochrome c family protein
VLIVVIIAFVAIIAVGSNAQLNRTVAIPDRALAQTIPRDTAGIVRGKHLATAINACVDCHGADLGGKVFLDVPPFRVVAPNLTRGEGGLGTSFTDADFVLALRYGLGPDHRRLIVMPSSFYTWLSDQDLADVIAYLKSVPPVDRVLPTTEFRPLGRALLVFGQLPPFPADVIGSTAVRRPTETPGVTVSYGSYLARVSGCIDCHGAGLSGGAIVGMPPDAPHAQNITPAGIGTWSDADFVHAIRTGTRPDGTTISTLMPWPFYSRMTDAELAALLKYLRQAPPRPTGTR